MSAFFSDYELNDIYDITVKYNTFAADYYRRRNLNLSVGLTMKEEAPDLELGRTLLDGRRLDSNGEPQELSEEEKLIVIEKQVAIQKLRDLDE